MKTYQSISSIIILSIIIPSTRAQFQFNETSTSTPMIIARLAPAQLSYDAFNLVFYTDLQPFYHLKNSILHAIDSIYNITKQSNISTFSATTAQLIHQKALILENEQLVDAFRSKRFILCEFCGKINHYITGVMDAESARKYDDLINAVINQTIDQQQLLKNQSPIIESTLNFNKNTFQKIENAVNYINNNQHAQNTTFDRIIRTLQAKTDIQAIIQDTQMAISEYNRLTAQIRRTFTDTHSGKIPEMIPNNLLTEELKRISTILNINQQLPIDAQHVNALSIFKTASYKSTLYNQRIIVEINIPIAEREQFSLFKAIPIPITSNNNTFITAPFSTYFLLNADQTKYIAITRKQMDLGSLLANGEMLYKPTSTIQLSDNGICEWKIIKNPEPTSILSACIFTQWLSPNTIIPILENKLLFISTKQPLNLLEKCKTNDFTLRRIRNSGTISLDPECSIKTNNVIIHSRKTITLNATKIIIPTIELNLTTTITIENPSLTNNKTIEPLVIHDTTELEAIIGQSRKLTEEANREIKLQQIHYDSTTFSLFSGILSGLLSSCSMMTIIAVICLLILYKCDLLTCILPKLLKRASNLQHGDGTVVIEMNH